MWKRTLIVLLIAGGLGLGWSQRSVRHGPGVIAPEDPRQERLLELKQIRLKGSTITPLADFEVEARVLSKRRYFFDRGAKLSPVDLALGWGPMSDERVIDELDISQGGRWYRWRAKQYPIPPQEIVAHSSNMHMIPATASVRSKLNWVREGHVVRLRGYLVSVKGDDGGIWLSSTSRTDTGDGACEVVYVTDLNY